MNSIIVILLILALIKFVFFGVILMTVFRPDVKRAQREWVDRKQAKLPPCMYCGSLYTHARDEGQTRWDNAELVLVTEFECEHCQLPFWHVQRIETGLVKF